jgi:hypothetical protein
MPLNSNWQPVDEIHNTDVYELSHGDALKEIICQRREIKVLDEMIEDYGDEVEGRKAEVTKYRSMYKDEKEQHQKTRMSLRVTKEKLREEVKSRELSLTKERGQDGKKQNDTTFKLGALREKTSKVLVDRTKVIPYKQYEEGAGNRLSRDASECLYKADP